MVSFVAAWDNRGMDEISMDENTYSDLTEWLMEVDATTSASGFDGQLAGMWCRHSLLPDDLALDEVDRNVAAWALLLEYSDEVRRRLEDPDCSYEPLMPADSAPLRDRVIAMVEFSAGMLFGIGSAGEIAKDLLSEDVMELLKDLAEICKTNVNDEGPDAEEAYTEIVEYLKVAAQTLYVELHPQAD